MFFSSSYLLINFKFNLFNFILNFEAVQLVIWVLKT